MQNKYSTKILNAIARELACRVEQVKAVTELLEEGATIPFIARYRKEVTGGLDDIQLRKLQERASYLVELEDRRVQISRQIDQQGKLTSSLSAKIDAAETKAELEDLYAPYKTKIKTRAMIAIENGLEPLADTLLVQSSSTPEVLAEKYLSDKVTNVAEALAGARDILVERAANNPETVKAVRETVKKSAKIATAVTPGSEEKAEKYADYFAFSESWKSIPSHRALAILRASNAGLLSLELAQPEEDVAFAKTLIANSNKMSLKNSFLAKAVDWAWRIKFAAKMRTDLVSEMRDRAENEAIDVFVRNLKELLLAAPAGHKVTMGLDPGIRTGVKVAVVDQTGKLLETATVYPFQPQNDVSGSILKLRRMVETHKVELIAIGNGTASRETDRLAAQVLSVVQGTKPMKVIVSEAGASVYSASELASREMPGIDVSLRGAVSIARRLQDPLAELVKIEPKAIGVGQYQHDVDQTKLEKALDAAVEDAVNAVGVDLNTASAPLLSRISGLGPSLAQAIVDYRDMNGPFQTRQDLLKVARLGEKAFRQCAGFLRIANGGEPLDASAVHPEAYDVARAIVKACGRDVRSLMGDAKALAKINPEKFVNEQFGLPTVKDIINELKKPGRDPRPEFKTATLSDKVHEIADLKPGMRLEGTVTNVAAFGAFVDIGVHQDGLVHVSELSDRFVKDPSDVVRVGQIVKVAVIGVDRQKKKISLSMKSSPEFDTNRDGVPSTSVKQAKGHQENAFAAAFRKAQA